MAIFKGIDDVCLQADIAPSDLTQIIHGTTLATNSLIERKGAKTALITTEGFRDVIEMRTESRFEQYDLNLSLPDPLLSREHRYVLKERIDARGRNTFLRRFKKNNSSILPVSITEKNRCEFYTIGILKYLKTTSD